MTIKLDEIATGDEVVLQDRAENVVTGKAVRTSEQCHVRAFGVTIVFAALSRMGNWRVNPDVKLVGHTPALFPQDAA